MHARRVGFFALAAAFGLLAASVPADAQDRARTRITVQKRSYLDAGTVVKPVPAVVGGPPPAAPSSAAAPGGGA